VMMWRLGVVRGGVGVVGGGDVACALVVGCDVACGRCQRR
jgi:hypothetical protein